MIELGKLLIMLGFFLIITGLLLMFSDKIPLHFGRLPGDISYQKGNFSFYFPLTTSIVLSVIFSLLIYLFSKFFR